MSTKRVFLYVQHLLGIGHLRRAAAIAAAAAARGLEVTLASGGPEVAGLARAGFGFVQLEPASAADSSFKVLLGADGKPVDEAWKGRRRDQLLAAFRASRPDALVVELFPFGRRQMRFELVPLLDAAHALRPRPLIVSSVRDVLGGGQRDGVRQDEMLETFERYFDRLLVHGDPAFVPFERTFRHAARLAGRLHYTGYVIEPATPAQGDAGKGEVIVSAGGGAVGGRLLETAILCRARTTLADRCWRVLTGVNADARALQSLRDLAARTGNGDVVVERFREDFRTLLRNSSLSVSQLGYNTLVEILEARARAVAVPFAGSAETEQALRGRLLAARGRIELVEEAACTPETLAAAVDRAMAGPPPGASPLDLGGAGRTAELLERWLAERSA